MKIGVIDQRAVAPTNRPPALSTRQAAARVWRPGEEFWRNIQQRSTRAPATITIRGYSAESSATPISFGSTSIHTSTDSVGAPIFYRDVPLMPAETEKGVIKPLAPKAAPPIAW
ncbi:MAG: hypothetical protein HY821_02930 [Acidobacteria bacterium]|nr:hypothetical protein [Acidobacteriota bacterium]